MFSRYPAYRRGPWSQDEDRRLLRLIHDFGRSDWTRISESIQSRSPKQCRDRYLQRIGHPQPPFTPSNGQDITAGLITANRTTAGLTAASRTTASRNPLSTSPSLCENILFPTLVASCLITTGGFVGFLTYFIVQGIQRKVAKDTVNAHSASWIQKAREEVYDACYDSCSNCLEPTFSHNACNISARVNVAGAICDGSKIWNWKDRYPGACLKALGEMYKADAVESLLRSSGYRATLIVLSIVFGFIVCVAIGYHFLRVYRRRSRTTATAGASIPLQSINTRASGPPHPLIRRLQGSTRASGPPPPDFTPSAPVRNSTTQTTLHGGRGAGRGREASLDSELGKASEELHEPSSAAPNTKSTFRSIPAALGFAALFGKTNAWFCNDNVTIRHFTNADSTIFGDVHGWLSECYKYECNCRKICTPGAIDEGRIILHRGPESCVRTCDTCTGVKTGSLEYVDRIKPKVALCGFRFVDVTVGDAWWRVANAMIEENWLVTISVNTYNVTQETAQEVLCLHAIGHEFP